MSGELTTEREKVIHELATVINIIVLNVAVLQRKHPADDETEILMDMALACDRAVNCFRMLRRV